LSEKPKILVFAGPNGSGKSSISESYDIEGIYINADDIKQKRKCSDIEAAVEAENLREDCVRNKRSFTFETVLSTRRNLELLIRAGKSGYNIKSVFVLTADPELNVFRVKSRVCNGGHDVPADKIRSRYYKSLKNIRELAELSDEFCIFDNTGKPEIIYYKSAWEQIIYGNRYWSGEEIRKLL
jgi:predicted ABC-type ATPase